MSESRAIGIDYLLQTFRKAEKQLFFLIGQAIAISLTTN